MMLAGANDQQQQTPPAIAPKAPPTFAQQVGWPPLAVLGFVLVLAGTLVYLSNVEKKRSRGRYA